MEVKRSTPDKKNLQTPQVGQSLGATLVVSLEMYMQITRTNQKEYRFKP
jgi:hypothetical protein